MSGQRGLRDSSGWLPEARNPDTCGVVECAETFRVGPAWLRDSRPNTRGAART
jgi:hypothetical protein